MERFICLTTKEKQTKAKFYAVAAGRTPGIYDTWEEAEVGHKKAEDLVQQEIVK